MPSLKALNICETMAEVVFNLIDSNNDIAKTQANEKLIKCMQDLESLNDTDDRLYIAEVAARLLKRAEKEMNIDLKDVSNNWNDAKDIPDFLKRRALLARGIDPDKVDIDEEYTRINRETLNRLADMDDDENP